APVLGVVENMSGLFVGADGAKLAADAGVPFLGSVPFDRAIARAGDQGDPFVATAPESGAAMALRRIAGGIRDVRAPRPACARRREKKVGPGRIRGRGEIRESGPYWQLILGSGV